LFVHGSENPVASIGEVLSAEIAAGGAL